MSDNAAMKFVEGQDWLKPIGEKSDALIERAMSTAGKAGSAAKEVLINSRLFGHKRHPMVTDIPFGSWTVTLVADALDMSGMRQFKTAADTSLAVGLAASLIASAGGMADLSETRGKTDRSLGIMHGVLQGVTTLLYGGSFLARRLGDRRIGRTLSAIAFGTFIASSYLANELAERRSS